MAAAASECTLAHYRLEGPLGYGGMGIVFLARDTRLDRPVAIKLLPSDRQDQQVRRRVRDEALALSCLHHPNVAAVFDHGSHGDIDYLVMEFVPGTTLEVLLQNGPLDPHSVASLGAQLGRGLGAAHACGIVHRDIKPANLRVTPDGLLKILDFGLATLPPTIAPSHSTWPSRATSPGLAGTLAYMPPERFRGTPAGPRADIYSAGAVLYEMACGRMPFHQIQSARLIESILCARPARPSLVNPRVGHRLESIILRALDPDPRRRFASALDFAGALDRLAGPQVASGSVSTGKLGRWVTRMASSLMS